MKYYCLLLLLLISVTTFGFDIQSNPSAFCIYEADDVREIILTVNHEVGQSYHSISGIDQIGILGNVVSASPTETRIGIDITDALTARVHQITVEMIDNVSQVTSNTVEVDVFDVIERILIFNPDEDLIYTCHQLSINFKTTGDIVTKEVVRLYVNGNFFREQALTIENNIGTLSNLIIDRPLEDSLHFEMFLESSRNSSCLNNRTIDEISVVPPQPKAFISSNYSSWTEEYGRLIFYADSSINTDQHNWQVYEDNQLIDEFTLESDEDFEYTFSTSNYDKANTASFKDYSVVLSATDASGGQVCDDGKDTLQLIKVDYFPRIKVPTAVSLHPSAFEDSHFKIKIRDHITFQDFKVEVYSENQNRVFSSEDPLFIFGDNEELTDQFYTAIFSIVYTDGFSESFKSTFIVTP
ncbi:hypothetical protein MY04_3147 [Flammeovirga sp. MY04]|uniref:hypothetical protein n=1 Tax=Flammeovirga sp. MY04 TaxID=1191459 RepID=UPI000806366F|nr:hypothetical protein [Flammeovirga sp. MY04]ANQ50512.1 hypothetical protein MY04_3147 [Flammeovirga sp. MY04]